MPSPSSFRTRLSLLLLWGACTACHGLVAPSVEGDDGALTCDGTGGCEGVCTPGDTRCSATINGVETCDATGQWGPAAACVAQTCVASGTTASCRGVCEHADARCTDATHVQTCNASGAWDDPVVCANAACLAAASPTPRCGGTCTPGETRCSNNDVETCTATGSWRTTQACGDRTCVKTREGQPQCQRVCAVGQTQCSNNGFQSCENGQWRGPITDISAGQGKIFSSSVVPSALIDTVAGKLLVVTLALNNSRKIGLVRCDLDGSACVYADLFAGPSVGGFSAVIDVAGSKLLVVTQDNTSKPILIRCNLDGSACTNTDISAGQGVNISEPSAVIDTAGGKLLVVGRDTANSNRPGLLRCNLDGSACAYADVSAGQGGTSGYDPSAVIDATDGKLLIVTRNDANLGKPGLFRCNLDGSACAYTDISAGEGTGSGWFPHAFVDTSDGKLLVVTSNRANSAKPALFRCNLDGSACAHTDISAGKAILMSDFSAVIDAAAGKLLVLTDAYSSYKALEGVRCDLDGSGCAYIDIPASDFLYSPSAVINPSGGLLVAMGGYSALALFNVCF